jgi:hypothetical protein
MATSTAVVMFCVDSPPVPAARGWATVYATEAATSVPELLIWTA